MNMLLAGFMMGAGLAMIIVAQAMAHDFDTQINKDAFVRHGVTYSCEKE